MKHTLRHTLMFCVALVALALHSPAHAKVEKKSGEASLGITILASTSLTDALTEISRIYAKKKGITVSSFFEAPSELAGTIEQGESADVYISEDKESFTRLKQQGLIDAYDFVSVAKNRIALCVPSDSHLLRQFKAPAPLNQVLPGLHERTIIVIPDPETVPLGTMARDVFASMGHWKAIKSVMLRAENDRRSLYLIAKAKNTGVVYTSDTHNNPEVMVLSHFPAKSHPPIVYQAAVVAGLNMQPAREFLEFLKSRQARAVFKKYGFLEP